LRTESPWLRWMARLWLGCLGFVGVHQWLFWQGARLDTNVLALLPMEEQDALQRAAAARLGELGERRVVVLVGATEPESAQQAAAMVRNDLLAAPQLLRPADEAASDPVALARSLQPWRDRLLTTAQRRELANADVDARAQRALADLYQPLPQPRLSPWIDDPLSLWPAWWAERAGVSRARPHEGWLMLEGEGRHWVVLNLDVVGKAFSVTGTQPLGERLAAARIAMQSRFGGVDLLAAGVPLHAEAAAAQASFEVNTIGWGSLLAVLALVWVTFRSLRPIALVGLSLIAGCAVALSVTAMWFGQVHLLTLVFGASLVGVAEDYGFHWFAARQSQQQATPQEVLRQILPGLALALATSVVAYLALGLAPFPGLRQMAVFSATGLAAAFLTVVLLFPVWDHGAVDSTVFSRRFAASLARWPRWRANATGVGMALVLVAFVVGGLARLRSSDDLRQLHAAPPDVLAMQQRIGALLGLPSPAQFFLVEADDIDTLLVREERLTSRLDVLVADAQLTGFQALSQWLPSAARQGEQARLTARLERAAIHAVNVATGDSLARPDFAALPLTLSDLRGMPAAALPMRTWLGRHDGREGSIVLLNGVDPDALAVLADAAADLDGVRFVDRSADISALLGRYRAGIGEWLVAGYAGVLLLLLWRYRGVAWRAWLPTVLGSLLTLAIFGWAGWPVQLFGVLALLLLLGMGVDYGIFLVEHPGDGSAWLAVALAGISTLLAFGLLALSATPALHAFGLTMLLGELSIWLITPFLRPPEPSCHA
jgi:predicted exporter